MKILKNMKSKKNGELWINFNGQDVLNLVDNAIQKFI